MSGEFDIVDPAAEYVLGTLDAAERAAFAGRLAREPALRAAVSDWERRLGPLVQLVPPVSPPASLGVSIGERLATPAGVRAASARQTPMADVVNLALQRRLRRWKITAAATTAMAASLAIVLGLRETTRPAADQNFVAVFQKDDASPSFVMSVDLGTRTLSIRRVSAETPPGKTYQLWIKADPLGPDPKSLGLVEGNGTLVKAAIAGIDPSVVEKALFGVSLEPAGGSPTGKPTGPVFHAKLIPTAL